MKYTAWALLAESRFTVEARTRTPGLYQTQIHLFFTSTPQGEDRQCPHFLVGKLSHKELK